MIVNRLPELMEQKNVSIRQLSRKTGVTYTTIRAVYHSERRSVQLEVLDAICEALNVQPGDIYIQRSKGQAAKKQPADTAVTTATGSMSEGMSLETDHGTIKPAKEDNADDWKSW